MTNIININDKNKSCEITPIEKISLQKESNQQDNIYSKNRGWIFSICNMEL